MKKLISFDDLMEVCCRCGVSDATGVIKISNLMEGRSDMSQVLYADMSDGLYI